jgi:hypothetical protein
MTGETRKALTMTERGPGRELSSYEVSYASQQANVNFSYTGKEWFGPLPPLKPIAPPEVAGRTFDYAPGYNLNTTARPYEPVDFQTLRALANAYDPLRLIIERRKDQMTRLPWTIRVKHDGAKKRPTRAALSAATRSRIRDIEAFFKQPDFEVGFRSWLRALLEDLFVVDAPTLFCERNRGGDLVALRVIDGSTVKRVIDEWGRLPRPFPWTGEAFVWNGEAVMTENFAALGFKLIRGLVYPPAYQQILKGLPAVNYTIHDMIYRPLNIRPGHVYGHSPVEQVLLTVRTALARTLSQFQYYQEGNMPEGLLALPESWTPDQVQRFQDYFDNLHVGNLGQRRRMKFIAGGKSAYTPLREPPLKTEFDEWLVRIVCAAFSYPPSAFVTLSNRSIAEQHEKTAEQEGLEPVKQWAADLFNEIISRDFEADELEFAWMEEDEIDQEKQAGILSRYVETGILSINQARKRLGEEPDPSPAANTLMVKTTTGMVPIGTASTNKGNVFDDDDNR